MGNNADDSRVDEQRAPSPGLAPLPLPCKIDGSGQVSLPMEVSEGILVAAPQDQHSDLNATPSAAPGVAAW